MTGTHALADVIGPTLADWLDTDEHRDQAYALHQLIATTDGPYVAAAWLTGVTPRAIRNDHSADARAAAHAQINGHHVN